MVTAQEARAELEKRRRALQLRQSQIESRRLKALTRGELQVRTRTDMAKRRASGRALEESKRAQLRSLDPIEQQLSEFEKEVIRAEEQERIAAQQAAAQQRQQQIIKFASTGKPAPQGMFTKAERQLISDVREGRASQQSFASQAKALEGTDIKIQEFFPDSVEPKILQAKIEKLSPTQITKLERVGLVETIETKELVEDPSKISSPVMPFKQKDSKETFISDVGFVSTATGVPEVSKSTLFIRQPTPGEKFKFEERDRKTTAIISAPLTFLGGGFEFQRKIEAEGRQKKDIEFLGLKFPKERPEQADFFGIPVPDPGKKNLRDVPFTPQAFTPGATDLFFGATNVITSGLIASGFGPGGKVSKFVLGKETPQTIPKDQSKLTAPFIPFKQRDSKESFDPRSGFFVSTSQTGEKGTSIFRAPTPKERFEMEGKKSSGKSLLGSEIKIKKKTAQDIALVASLFAFDPLIRTGAAAQTQTTVSESKYIYDYIKKKWVKKKDVMTRFEALGEFARSPKKKQLDVLELAFKDRVYLDQQSLLQDFAKAKKFVKESGVSEEKANVLLKDFLRRMNKKLSPGVEEAPMVVDVPVAPVTPGTSVITGFIGTIKQTELDAIGVAPFKAQQVGTTNFLKSDAAQITGVIKTQAQKEQLKTIELLSTTQAGIQFIGPKIKGDTKTKISSLSATGLASTQLPRTKQASSSKVLSLSATALKTKQVSKSAQKLRAKEITKQKPRTRLKPRRTPRPFSLPSGVDKTAFVKKLVELKKKGVDVIVGMKMGKQRVLAKNLPPFKAAKKAQRFVDENIEASYLLKKSGKNFKGKDIKPFNKSKKFRSSRKNPLFVVEHRKFRLDSPGEKRQIKKVNKKTKRRLKKK